MSKIASHNAQSVWKISEPFHFSASTTVRDFDVCVVGAGIAGLTTAYLLSRSGRRVLVLEASDIGAGETGNTSAHLASVIDDRFTELEKLFGDEGAFLAAESHRFAISLIECIVREEGIDCGFERVPGYLYASRSEDSAALLEEYRALLRAGFSECELLESVPFPSNPMGPCVRIPDQAQFQPLIYLHGLARAVNRHGGTIVRSEVTDIQAEAPYQILTRQGDLYQARQVVMATNTPFNNRYRTHNKQAAYRTYMLAFDIPNGSLPKGLYWDMQDPYHYIRLYEANENQTLLLIGGEDHKTGQSEDPDGNFQVLEAWTRATIPEIGALVARWSGQILEPVDGLAFIGKNPGDEDIYIVTGDSGNGLTHGTIAAMIFNDLLQKRPNPWEKLYDPARMPKSLQGVKELFKELINVALQYRDYLSPSDLSGVEAIALGEGAILRQGLHKVAVYRDHQNELHELSPVCPHLGGLVRWNKVEKTWDCPCHGSRFSYRGEVVNGPAKINLAPASSK
jgi:glycine/D-amino acid oxidase-like deaminating enzyme/nitrite reductase/ring-hydroxylating ferredoxin subunit